MNWSEPRHYTKVVITKIKLANELNPSGQIFPLDNMYNLSALVNDNGYDIIATKYGYDREGNVQLGDGLIWCCMDCNGEFTRPELNQYDAPNKTECCLDCSAKPKMMCSCGNNEKYYHSDKTCDDCRHSSSLEISTPYSNGTCASILRM